MPRIGHRPMYGLMPMLGAKQVAGAAYTANTARFESANTEYMDAAISPADSNTFTLSVWMRRITGGVAHLLNFGPSGNTKATVRATAGDAIVVYLVDTANAPIGTFTSTGTIAADGNWHHLMIACDNSLGTERLEMYIDGTDSAPAFSPSTNVAIWFTRAGPLTTVSRNPNGTAYHDACLSDLWFSTELILPSVHLAKFRSAGGKPVDPYNGGAWPGSPTTAQPEIFLKDGNTSFGTNYGSIGNLTPTGTLSDCASGPSD